MIGHWASGIRDLRSRVGALGIGNRASGIGNQAPRIKDRGSGAGDQVFGTRDK